MENHKNWIVYLLAVNLKGTEDAAADGIMGTSVVIRILGAATKHLIQLTAKTVARSLLGRSTLSLIANYIHPIQSGSFNLSISERKRCEQCKNGHHFIPGMCMWKQSPGIVVAGAMAFPSRDFLLLGILLLRSGESRQIAESVIQLI